MDHPVIPELLEQVNEASTGLAKFSWTIPQAGQLWCSPHSMEPAECHHIYKHVLDKKGQKKFRKQQQFYLQDCLTQSELDLREQQRRVQAPRKATEERNSFNIMQMRKGEGDEVF